MADILPQHLKPVTLPVLDNTGHQFFVCRLLDFYELEVAEDPGLKTAMERIKKHLLILAQDNQGPFMVWNDTMPWLRFRYVIEGDEPAIIIAVDTTLAESKEGLVYYMTEADGPEVGDGDSAQISPYACRSRQDFEIFWNKEGTIPLEYLPVVHKPDQRKYPQFPQNFPINGVVHFKPLAVREGFIKVDLIVDLGNTRTVALLLQHKGVDTMVPFKDRVMALWVTPRGRPFEKPTGIQQSPSYDAFMKEFSIVDSWLLLHRPLFSHLEPTLDDVKDPENAFKRLRQKKFPEEHLPRLHYGPPKEVQDPITGGTKWLRPWLVPRTFVEISPALIGGGKAMDGAYRKFAQVSLSEGARFYLSSPKRYAWDDRSTAIGDNPEWKMINDVDPEKQPFQSLSGTFRYFMDDGPNAVDRSPDEGNDPLLERGPSALLLRDNLSSHPTRDTICWFALSLLETAYRQINSTFYRNKWPEKKEIPRRLMNLRVTYPTGWTYEERDRYLKQWERAINIFAATHLSDPRSVKDGGQRPILSRETMDEAVASQLPVIYSEIKVLWNNIPAWLDLYGDGAKATVMNVDIGGGTTDWAIVDYQKSPDKQDTDLVARVKFRDGCNIAGDMLVKRIIERLLLPGWLKASDVSRYQGNPNFPSALERLFYDPGSDAVKFVDDCARLKMNRIVRLVFVPLANKLLEMLVTNAGKPMEALNIRACVEDGSIAAQPLLDLNNMCVGLIEGVGATGPNAAYGAEPAQVFSMDAKIAWEQRFVDECIEDVFSKSLFSRLRHLVTQFDVNLLIVSGKPSELPQVREQIHRHFPLLPQRIIHSRNYQAGEWYPDSFRTVDGKIKDAKTVTVVGAALFQEIANGDETSGFNVEIKVSQDDDDFSKEYAWGVLPDTRTGENVFMRAMFSGEDYRNARRLDESTIYVEKVIDRIPLGCRVGRIIDSRVGDDQGETRIEPAQVYVLQYTDDKLTKNELLRKVYCKVTVRWISERGKGDHLELRNIEAEEAAFQDRVHPGVVKLVLNTLNAQDGLFWMDNPRFDVSFEAVAKAGRK